MTAQIIVLNHYVRGLIAPPALPVQSIATKVTIRLNSDGSVHTVLGESPSGKPKIWHGARMRVLEPGTFERIS